MTYVFVKVRLVPNGQNIGPSKAKSKAENAEQTNIEGSLTLWGGFYLVTFFITPKIRKQKVIEASNAIKGL